jgi:hypothetical protein
VPERFTTCGLVSALSVKVSAPVAAPATVGENVTPTVQLLPAATLVPHVLLTTLNPELAATGLKVKTALRSPLTRLAFDTEETRQR